MWQDMQPIGYEVVEQQQPKETRTATKTAIKNAPESQAGVGRVPAAARLLVFLS